MRESGGSSASRQVSRMERETGIEPATSSLGSSRLRAPCVVVHVDTHRHRDDRHDEARNGLLVTLRRDGDGAGGWTSTGRCGTTAGQRTAGRAGGGDREVRHTRRGGAERIGRGHMRDGEMLLERAWGVADIEKNVSASKSTTYPVGSVTKQFTAPLVLKQIDRGRLTLTDPIGKHLAGLTAEVSCPFTGHDRKDIRGVRAAWSTVLTERHDLLLRDLSVVQAVPELARSLVLRCCRRRWRVALCRDLWS